MAQQPEWTMTTAENITFTMKIIDGYLYATSDKPSAWFAGKIPDAMSNIILDKSRRAALKFSHNVYDKLEYTVTQSTSPNSSSSYICILKADPLKRAPNMDIKNKTQDQLLLIVTSEQWQELRIEHHLQKIELTKEQEKNRTLKILLTNALHVANS